MALHRFRAGKSDETCLICASGTRATHDTCESCGKSGPIDLWTGTRLCGDCVTVQSAETTDPQEELRIRLVTELLEKFKAEASDQPLFTGHVTPITEIEAQLKDKGLDDSAAVEETIRLIEANITSYRAQIDQLGKRAIREQKYLSALVPALRTAAREKYRAYDIRYSSGGSTRPGSVTGPNLDQNWIDMGKRLGISAEQAKLAMQHAIQASVSERPALVASARTITHDDDDNAR